MVPTVPGTGTVPGKLHYWHQYLVVPCVITNENLLLGNVLVYCTWYCAPIIRLSSFQRETYVENEMVETENSTGSGTSRNPWC